MGEFSPGFHGHAIYRLWNVKFSQIPLYLWEYTSNFDDDKYIIGHKNINIPPISILMVSYYRFFFEFAMILDKIDESMIWHQSMVVCILMH